MRLLILSVAFSVVASTAAFAVGAGWHGPGWYIMMSTPVKAQSLYRGAYHTQDECNADKPADHGAVTYECVQVNNQPLDGGY
jgi:hypothetical protein